MEALLGLVFSNFSYNFAFWSLFGYYRQAAAGFAIIVSWFILFLFGRCFSFSNHSIFAVAIIQLLTTYAVTFVINIPVIITVKALVMPPSTPLWARLVSIYLQIGSILLDPFYSLFSFSLSVWPGSIGQMRSKRKNFALLVCFVILSDFIALPFVIGGVFFLLHVSQSSKNTLSGSDDEDNENIASQERNQSFIMTFLGGSRVRAIVTQESENSMGLPTDYGSSNPKV
ncbi:hypothetical protein ADUPG1_007700 [Aduncisulcus paluster]|uniref:Integral membrane protein n=1 Tax=Aduncisulcus paluster TaxID=2918883 RepID=A0ABQ5KPC8_9EUKA|nr:hypothetical protein ADUPG1_007700 [Aduncisulcus paluster]